MREDESDVRVAGGRFADDQADDRPRGIGRVLEHLIGDPRDHVLAAHRVGRMRVHDRLAPVQFFEQRRERSIPEPRVAIAGEQADAIGFQRVERVLQFLQAAWDIRQRQHREQTETPLVIRDHLRGGVLVHLPRELACFLYVAEPDARRSDRKHGGRDPDAIERFNSACRRIAFPRGEARHRRHGIFCAERGEKAWRHEVLVDIDAARRRGGRALGLGGNQRRQERSGAEGRHRGEEFAAGCHGAVIFAHGGNGGSHTEDLTRRERRERRALGLLAAIDLLAYFQRLNKRDNCISVGSTEWFSSGFGWGASLALLHAMLIDAPFNDTTHRILNAAIEVHRTIGPGLLESAYGECLELELAERDLKFERQRHVSIFYKGTRLVTSYRADLIVEDLVVVEVKSMAATSGKHEAQIITYLKLTGCPAGLLINYNVQRLMDGVKRFINPGLGALPIVKDK